MFYRFGTTPLPVYGKSLLRADMKSGDFGIELTEGRMVMAFAPKDEGVQWLVLGGAEGTHTGDNDEPRIKQVDAAPALVFKEIEWRLSQKGIDTSGATPAPGSVVIGIEEPMLIGNATSELQAVGLRSGNVYKLTADQHVRLRARDWRLDGFVDSSLVISLFENAAAADPR